MPCFKTARVRVHSPLTVIQRHALYMERRLLGRSPHEYPIQPFGILKGGSFGLDVSPS